MINTKLSWFCIQLKIYLAKIKKRISKIQLVSRLSQLAHARSLSRMQNKIFPEFWQKWSYYLPEEIKQPKLSARANKIYVGMPIYSTSQGQGLDFVACSSLGALCSLKPCSSVSQLAKQHEFTIWSVKKTLP